MGHKYNYRTGLRMILSPNFHCMENMLKLKDSSFSLHPTFPFPTHLLSQLTRQKYKGSARRPVPWNHFPPNHSGEPPMPTCPSLMPHNKEALLQGLPGVATLLVTQQKQYGGSGFTAQTTRLGEMQVYEHCLGHMEVVGLAQYLQSRSRKNQDLQAQPRLLNEGLILLKKQRSMVLGFRGR